MKIFGYQIMIVSERECNALTAGIKRLRAERAYYKGMYEDLRRRVLEDVHPEAGGDLEEAFVRFENAQRQKEVTA